MKPLTLSFNEGLMGRFSLPSTSIKDFWKEFVRSMESFQNFSMVLTAHGWASMGHGTLRICGFAPCSTLSSLQLMVRRRFSIGNLEKYTKIIEINENSMPVSLWRSIPRPQEFVLLPSTWTSGSNGARSTFPTISLTPDPVGRIDWDGSTPLPSFLLILNTRVAGVLTPKRKVDHAFSDYT